MRLEKGVKRLNRRSNSENKHLHEKFKNLKKQTTSVREVIVNIRYFSQWIFLAGSAKKIHWLKYG